MKIKKIQKTYRTPQIKKLSIKETTWWNPCHGHPGHHCS
jgi:hypothetical protein